MGKAFSPHRSGRTKAPTHPYHAFQHIETLKISTPGAPGSTLWAIKRPGTFRCRAYSRTPGFSGCSGYVSIVLLPCLPLRFTMVSPAFTPHPPRCSHSVVSLQIVMVSPARSHHVSVLVSHSIIHVRLQGVCCAPHLGVRDATSAVFPIGFLEQL